ncbi:MAG: sialidase family protein, partial [Ignavibacteria bacterium]
MKIKYSVSFSILFLILILSGPDFIVGNFKSGSGENFPGSGMSNNLLPNNNYRLFPSTLLQVETSSATDPSDSANVVAAAITNYFEGGYTIGFYKSTNKGANWTGTDHISNALGETIFTVGDPNINISGNGNYIITYIAASSSGSKVGVSYSANSGTYWSPTVYIPNVDTADKPISISDNITTSPYYGRIYAAYGELNFNQTQTKGIFFSYSSNGGVTWDSSKRITNINSFQHRLAGDITVGPAGELYVMWFTNSNFLGLSKSTNGGSSWIINNDLAISTNNALLSTSFTDFYLHGVPVLKVDHTAGSRNGWLYAVNLQTSTDSMDIVLHRSTNGGNNWAHIKVNQDGSGPVKIQGMPALNVDRYGGINIFYYDTRNSPANDSFEVYLSRSVNGGTNFTDLKVSGHKFKLGPPQVTLFGIDGYIGSYIGVTEGIDKLIPVWFDNSTLVYQREEDY